MRTTDEPVYFANPAGPPTAQLVLEKLPHIMNANGLNADSA